MSDDEANNYSSYRKNEEEEEERRREEQRRRDQEMEEARREVERKREAAADRKKREEEEKEKEKGGKKGKRKGLGGLSREKRKMLKTVIMQKAANDMKEQMAKKKAEKESYIKSVVEPFDITGLDDAQLQKRCKEYHKRLTELEEQKFDGEQRNLKQEFEMNELTLKVNDVKGKFVKPVLKKVAKTDIKMAKFKHNKENIAFRDHLKSAGQNKFALEEEKHEQHKPDWSKDKHEGHKEGEDGETVELEVEAS